MATTGLYSQHLNNRKKLHARNAVIALLLVLFAVLALFPIFYMIMSSFGPAIATAGNTRSIFPSKWTLDSYKAFFDFSKYSGRWILNSLIVATATVVGNVIFASMAGYAFSKINFKGRKWMFAMILVAMMIPYQVTQVPLYILIANKLKMTNTYAALILPGVVTSYNIFLAKQFFTSIPTPLIESAKLDGCHQFKIFYKDNSAAVEDCARGHGNQHVFVDLEHLLLAVPRHEQGLYVHHSGRSQDLQVCKRNAVCAHDGGRYALSAADVHYVLCAPEILP